MGADQSTQVVETPKSSPRLSKAKGHQGKESSKEGAQKHDIIVVAEGSTAQQTDPEVKKLEEIPYPLPIVKTSIHLSNMKDLDSLEKLDTRHLLQLCARYQDHLKQCAEAVAFDQNALCVRIKEIDFATSTLYNHLTERQRKYAKYAEQIQKIQEMQNVLNRVKMNVEQTVPLMERLNSVLPPSEQLEPFSMRQK